MLWGEYAVLADAPAAVAAIDRWADVSMRARPAGWQFSAAGLQTPGVYSQAQFTQAPIASLGEAILRTWGYDAYPATSAEIEIDTSAFYTSLEPHAPTKLGIGSSAAVCVALYAGLAKLLGHTPQMSEAMRIHTDWQGGKGSGLDVAASWHGGTIFFQSGQASPFAWPDDLHWCVVWTGVHAATSAHLASFTQWRDSAVDASTYDALIEATHTLQRKISLSNLAAYVEKLAAFDQAAKLNIFSQPHQRLATIADRLSVTYKPCGAGGGDIGIAIHDDPTQLAKFTETAAQEFIVLQSEIASHGVKVSG